MTACRVPQMSQTPTTPLPNCTSVRFSSRSSSRMGLETERLLEPRPIHNRCRRRRGSPSGDGSSGRGSWDSTWVELETVPVAGDKDVDAARPKLLGERPVRGDDPSPVADGRIENGRVAATGDGKQGESPGESQRGAGVRHPPSHEALDLVDHGRGNNDVRPRAKAFDLGLQRETGPGGKEKRVGVQEDQALRPGKRRFTGAKGRLRAGLGRVLRPLDVREARIAGLSGSRSSGSPRGTRGTWVP